MQQPGFHYIRDKVLSIYKSSSHDYSLSDNEFNSSIFLLLLLFFISVVLAVFFITTGVLLIKLHRCPPEDQEKDIEMLKGTQEDSEEEED